MSILDKITASKYREVEENKLSRPVRILEQSSYFSKQTRSLRESLLRKDLCGIIAEFKRKSPSKGIINSFSLPEDVCELYYKAGASAVSVLTDHEFFGGSLSDLTAAREKTGCPVLRKEFIIDEYQLIEARAIGADAVLLIAEMHDRKRLGQLYDFAISLQLDVLVEVHDQKNIYKIPQDATIVGINSRNLGSFEVKTEHLEDMIRHLPPNVIKVAESGISSVKDYLMLKGSGFNAFLIGGLFMSEPDPGSACRAFIGEIKSSLR